MQQLPAPGASCARGTKISGFRKVPGEASCTLPCLLRELHILPEVHTQVHRQWHAAGGREPVLCGPLDNLGEPAKCGWQPRRKPPSGVGHLLRGLPRSPSAPLAGIHQRADFLGEDILQLPASILGACRK